MGSNPGRRGGKPATNRLTYGAALLCPLLLALEEVVLASQCQIGLLRKSELVCFSLMIVILNL
jgi:hypothetical protein